MPVSGESTEPTEKDNTYATQKNTRVAIGGEWTTGLWVRREHSDNTQDTHSFIRGYWPEQNTLKSGR